MIINFFKKITPIIIFTFFFSCEKEITLELNNPEESLCLNCVMEAGNDSVLFHVTKTQFIEDTEEIEPIKNADIELRKDGQLLTGIVYKGKGKYLLEHTPVEGSEYEIKVNVDGYKPLFAKSKVPLKPIADVSFKRDTIYDDSWAKGYYTKARLFIQLQDLPAKDYYWFMRAFMRSRGGKQYGSYGIAYQTDRLFFDEFNRYYDQGYNYPFTNYDYIGALRLDDENILNGEIHFSMNTGNQPTLFVINADENFDRYYKSSIKQFLIYEYDQLPVFEPVQIYSNVENGFGIFGSIAVTRFYFNEEL